eukprot:GFYU01015479.1.p1 GENE.GFYU01015479.1~~GFYU01015479.1.p1  ORF type:complete len:430 (-),score=76.86 GFYU01015479.1:296-1585(-)
MGDTRTAFVLIDGLADVSLKEYGDLTPLQKAATPTMDTLAAEGMTGLLDPVEPGLACGSDTAHLNILGYDPRIYYRGRGAFESMGAGLDMSPGDIAFKCNFAVLDEASGMVTSRRADRHFEAEGPVLCNYLNGTPLPSFPEHQVCVKYATEHRCGVVVKGPGLSDAISGTDPLKDNRPLRTCEPTDESAEALMTSKLVNELTAVLTAKLKGHPLNAERIQQGKPPANVVLLRGCGSRIEVQTFEDRHKLKPFIIAPTCIIAGLAMSLHVEVKKAEGGTGDYHTNLHSKGQTLVSVLTQEEYEFGFLHIKAVDDAGHDKNHDLKVDFLQRIDTMVKEVVQGLRADMKAKPGRKYNIVITGDHSTPVKTGDHSFEPVPFLITALSAEGAVRDSVDIFDELQCAKGVLGRFPGSEIMGIIRRYADHVTASST